MFNFTYHNPVRIFFGKDQLKKVDSQIPANAKILITFGGGSAVKSGLLDKVKSVLGSRNYIEFGGIEPNPHYKTLMKAVDIVRNENIDFMLAVGGGSVLDGTKFISLASHYEGNASELLKMGWGNITSKIIKKVTPFGAILTLPATGSEMNPGAVISHGNGKFGVMYELLYPQFSVLDPTYTFTLPKIQVANGIVDTFVHTVEQYMTYPVDARIQDRFAEGILQTLIEIAPKNLNDPENYDARANLMWSATQALNGNIGLGVPQDWATHAIGHELTALFGIDHGQTLAIIYPALLEVRKNNKRAKLLQYAERVWQIENEDENEKINQAIQKTKDFFESLGIKTRMSEYGITIQDIPKIIENLQSHGVTKLSETGDLTLDVVEEILGKAF